MIQIPNDYDNARAFDGKGGPTITVGGHICRILSAKMETAKTSGAPMLVIAFDIAENSEFDGYYRAKHERAKGFNAEAKWQGVFRTNILNKQGLTNGYFKGLITSIEESNAGYNFKATGGDEGTLKGKLVGFNFGEREYQKSDGTIGTVVEPFYAVGVKTVREGIQPPDKKVLQGVQRGGSQGFQQVEDDYDLPFN